MPRSSYRKLLFTSASALGLVLALAPGCDDETSTTPAGTGVGTGSGTGTTTGTTTTGGGTPSGTSAGATGGGGTGGATGGTGGDVGGSGGAGGGGGAVGGGGGAVGGGGAGGGMAASQGVYYWGDFETDGVEQVALLDYPPGTPAVLALQGLVATHEINDVAVARDGSQIAVSAYDTATSTSVLSIYAADGSGAPVTVFDTTNTSNTDAAMYSLAWSPDGLRLAFAGDIDADGEYRVYAVDAAAASTPTRVSQWNAGNNQDAYDVIWADDTHVIYTGDLGAFNNVDCIWSVDVTNPFLKPMVAPCTAMTASMDVATAVPPQIDAQGRVYFRGDWVEDNHFRLYRADIDGNNLEQVPGTDIIAGSTDAEVGAFGLSPDGTRLAFSSETVDYLYNVYVLDLSATVPQLASNVQTVASASGTRGPAFDKPIWWSPDGSMIAVVADWEVGGGGELNDNYAVFVMLTDGTAGGVRVVRPVGTTNNDQASEAVWSADGVRMYVRGDLLTTDEVELFTLTDFSSADQAPSGLLIEDAPTDGDVFSFVLKPY